MKKSEALNILGLQEGYTPEELKAAHRKKVRESHPDRFAQDPVKKAQQEEVTKLINEARDVLESGKWEPEGGMPYGNPYANPYAGNPYGNPYANPYAQGGQTQYVWNNGTWTVYTNGAPTGTAGNPFADMPFNPFGPFGARPSSKATARRAFEIAQANLRSTIVTLIVLLGLCGFFMIKGNVFGAAIMFAMLVGMNMLLTRVGGCMWVLAFPVLFEAMRMGSASVATGPTQFAFAAVLFVLALVAEIRDVIKIYGHYKTTKEAYEKIMAESEESPDGANAGGGSGTSSAS